MKLYTPCKNCDAQISFWTRNSTRVQIKMTIGDSLKLKCKKCGKTAKYSINEMKAKPSKSALVIALIVFLVGTPLLFLVFREYMFKNSNPLRIITLISPAFLPAYVFGIILYNDKKRVRMFNRS